MDRPINFLCVCVLLAGTTGCRAFDFETPCDGVDCNDGSICTEDRCTFDLSGTTTCHHDPTNDDAECAVDGITLVCRDGRCGAESLCDGVECDDEERCTVDVCVWDGTCTFTPVDCSDDNDCTNDSCDSTTGACVHVPGDGVFNGLCLLTELPDENAIPTGVCEEGVCLSPCDPEIELASSCPTLGNGAFCCPGSEYCQNECP